MTLDENAKAFVLIENNDIYNVVTKELENCGFEAEGRLSEVSQCALILVDHDALMHDIVQYLNEKGIEKPILLILTQMQIYSTPFQTYNLFPQDVLVARNRGVYEPGIVISALDGDDSLRSILENYAVDVQSLMARQKEKPTFAYAPYSQAG